MGINNAFRIFKKANYTLIFLVVTAFIAWLYIGPLTNQAVYDTVAWIFAVFFPILIGLIAANQIYNLREVKTCPTSATTGGVLGGIAGIITVGCPVCPLVLFGWLGLGAGAAGGILGGPWIKLASLVVLVLALHWSAKR